MGIYRALQLGLWLVVTPKQSVDVEDMFISNTYMHVESRESIKEGSIRKM